MSITDELRRLLDELRKLARDINEEEIKSHSVITLSQGKYNRQLRLDMNCDWLNAWHAEHERILQTIAATLGRGTCHIVKTWSDSDYAEGWRYRCSECGCFIGVYERDPETGDVISADNYCPNCGRKVVD